MQDACNAIIDEIIEARKSKGWSQKDLSAACGITQSAIARLETKKAVPQLDTLARIASALGCTISLSREDL